MFFYVAESMTEVPDGSADLLADEAVELVSRWLTLARERDEDSAETRRLAELLDDPHGPSFAMRFVDLVIRPEDDRAAATQLRRLVTASSLPRFLGFVDRLLLRLGALFGPFLPGIVLPLARARMRSLIGHLIADAEPDRLSRHLDAARAAGNDLNVNLLGEAVLGEAEATRRLDATIALLERPDVDYVSVKISSIVAEFNLWAFDHTVDLIDERLRRLLRVAARGDSPKFVNLDMEEYEDLDLTLAAFMRILDEDEFARLTAGIVLQAYLPDSFGALQRLTEWAAARHRRSGGEIKVRLVKGANLAMERVAPSSTVGSRRHTRPRPRPTPTTSAAWTGRSPRSGWPACASVSQRTTCSTWRGRCCWPSIGESADRVDFEMLQGMAPAEAAIVRDAAGSRSVCTRRWWPEATSTPPSPTCSAASRRTRIRRTSSARSSTSIRAGRRSPSRSRASVALAIRHQVGPRPRDAIRIARSHPADRPRPARSPTTRHRPRRSRQSAWAAAIYARRPRTGADADDHDPTEVDGRSNAPPSAGVNGSAGRRPSAVGLLAVATRSRTGAGHCRGDDPRGFEDDRPGRPEVSEAVDFARYYADRIPELEAAEGAPSPLGVVAVVPPWNFPVAIPAGGMLAALAAGNA
jgi:RHH-type transcriptional regulator, proline utilization regulon repressor / proline dehydrogenase / delta 1-pyrroline-5-carboxylate dehydrogenase